MTHQIAASSVRMERAGARDIAMDKGKIRKRTW
jgi:hypothetical protein